MDASTAWPTPLPLTIAWLARRAFNSKSPKERHDSAYFAWEASVRLAAAQAPRNPASLALPSVGQWIDALGAGEELLSAPALVAAFALLAEQGTPRAVTRQKLLAALPAYRNRVLGHGALRGNDFYERAGEVLTAGLRAAWEHGAFFKPGATLVFVESVSIAPSGQREARVLALSGFASNLCGSGALAVPESVVPRRVYVQDAAGFHSLHPWILYRESSLLEEVLFFNGYKRGAQYLDYVGGEIRRSRELAEAYPGLDAVVEALVQTPVATAPEEPTSDPALFGDYRLLGKLGEGGMGAVYLARQEGLGRLVALKMLPRSLADDPVAVARFEREARALSRCDHPNVVKLYASGARDRVCYYAMELVEGADLAEIARALPSSADFDAAVCSASERVRRAKAEPLASVPELPHAPLPAIAPHARDRVPALAAAFRDTARALAHLHERGILHRDVKPANIMVSAADHRVVLMDLGLAAVQDASRSLTQDKAALLGTLRYMPPEQLQRSLLQLDARADVYALGATFYELFTGRPLFDGDSEARLVEQILREQPLPPSHVEPSLPKDLATILEKATRKEVEARYQTAAALADDLDAFLEGRPISARPPTLRYLAGLAIRRNKPLALSIAAALLVLAAGGVAFLTREVSLRRQAEHSLAEAFAEKAKRSERDHAFLAARVYAHQALSLQERPDTRGLVVAMQHRPDARLEGRLELARPVEDMVLSRDGRLAARLEQNERLVFWALDGGTAPKELGLPAPNPFFNVLAMSPTAEILAAGMGDGTARVWQLPALQERIQVKAGLTPVSSLALSPDGSVLATGGYGHGAIWDSRAGTRLGTLDCGADDNVDRLAFSPDGQLLAAAMGKRTVFYRAPAWERIGAFAQELAPEGRVASAASLAFSPNGTLALGNGLGVVYLVSVPEGRTLAVARRHDAQVTALAFSSDGDTLFSGDRLGKWIAWDAQALQPRLVHQSQRVGVVDLWPMGPDRSMGPLRDRPRGREVALGCPRAGPDPPAHRSRRRRRLVAGRRACRGDRLGWRGGALATDDGRARRDAGVWRGDHLPVVRAGGSDPLLGQRRRRRAALAHRRLARRTRLALGGAREERQTRPQRGGEARRLPRRLLPFPRADARPRRREAHRDSAPEESPPSSVEQRRQGAGDRSRDAGSAAVGWRHARADDLASSAPTLPGRMGARLRPGRHARRPRQLRRQPVCLGAAQQEGAPCAGSGSPTARSLALRSRPAGT
ncbi:MAG: serine/threonine-protein kinase [Myxococcales bacterium]